VEEGVSKQTTTHLEKKGGWRQIERRFWWMKNDFVTVDGVSSPVLYRENERGMKEGSGTFSQLPFRAVRSYCVLLPNCPEAAIVPPGAVL